MWQRVLAGRMALVPSRRTAFLSFVRGRLCNRAVARTATAYFGTRAGPDAVQTLPQRWQEWVPSSPLAVLFATESFDGGEAKNAATLAAFRDMFEKEVQRAGGNFHDRVVVERLLTIWGARQALARRGKLVLLLNELRLCRDREGRPAAVFSSFRSSE